MSTENENRALVIAGRDIGLNAVQNSAALASNTIGELSVFNGILSSVIGAFAIVSGSTIIPGNEAQAKSDFLKFVSAQYDNNFKIGQDNG